MYIITSTREGASYEGDKLEKTARDFLDIKGVRSVKLYDIYEVDGASWEEVEGISERVFSQEDCQLAENLDGLKSKASFRFRQLKGQYDQKQWMVERLIRTILGYEDVSVSHSRALEIEGMDQEGLETFKGYLLNPVESVEISWEEKATSPAPSEDDDLAEVEGFIKLDQKGLENLAQNFSMDADDLAFCQKYFQKEGRDPKVIELKVLDTYWSDHCRHTTFNTELDIRVPDGPYQGLFQTTLNDYLDKRRALNREDKPVSLMDMGTIQAKYLREKGLLDDLEISPEVNACALDIKVDVDGEEEDWVLYFKNETHNHPTEIEPYGGASTCIGGSVRDPLSGRSWVYQAMRISGADDPTKAYADTHPDKLSQRFICQLALEGYSDYSNEAGINASFAEEVYHPGFEAKRLELGALLAAAPRENVVRAEPKPGDKVLLLGGRTGRDGLGAAVGSSQVQTEDSLQDAGAEVQKGAPAVERKFMRLFRRPEAAKLIKRCNDFGAGGVAVAVGELADGLDIDLDQVPVKYPGLSGGEIALSESQERMAVVVAESDLDEFKSYADQEDVLTGEIATVTADSRMKLYSKGRLIVDLSRDFLNSAGAKKHAKAELTSPDKVFQAEEVKLDQARLEAYMSDLRRADQKAMAEVFDSSIGRVSLNAPYGGKLARTKELGMTSRLPVSGRTQTRSGMAYGYDPYLAENSPFHGGYYAVVESAARLVAMGFDYKKIRLSFQEFFESLGQDPAKWGKPVLALLGANQAMDGLNLASVGGKDSMSGTYEELNVPPTLISFAVATGKVKEGLSRSFKEEGSQLILLENKIQSNGTLDLDQAGQSFDRVHELANDRKILAASTVGYEGLLRELIEMAYGNGVGFSLTEEAEGRLLEPMMGSFVLELSVDEDPAQVFQGLDWTRIGQTEAEVTLKGQPIDLEAVYQASRAKLDPVYQNTEITEKALPEEVDKPFAGQASADQPLALIPVILGTTGEYDLADSIKEAGFKTQTLIIKDSSHEAFEEGMADLVHALKASDLLALPSGAVFGSEPDREGLIWEIILERPDVKTAVHQHLDQGKLVLGLGSAFKALIQTGLIEHGRITGETAIKVLPNPGGKFISAICQARVLSNHSAFSKNLLGQDYTAPVATPYGRIDLAEAADKMTQQGQIISAFKTYHSDENIDGLASPDGRVIGFISAIDRLGEDLYQNVGSVKEPGFLAEARSYYK